MPPLHSGECDRSALASPAATDQPSLERSWQVFLSHLPTMLLIWVATAVISGVGLVGQLGQLPFTLLSSLVGVLFVAVPALHYATGKTIGVEQAFRTLFQRPWRYLLAGLLFLLVTTVGFVLCIVPGIAVALVGPVYVNRIFNGDGPVVQTFVDSFQAVYRSPKGWEFVGIQVLAFLVVAVPVSTFFIQNAAYYKVVLT